MPRSTNPIDVKQPQRAFYGVQPWTAEHRGDCSEIKAYVEASGEWETVLTVHPTAGATAEALAVYVMRAINESKGNVLSQAMDALELVISNGLTFTSEQAVERAFRSLKRIGEN